MKKASGGSRAIKTPAVCCDHQRRTCLLVSHDGAVAEFIPFTMDGFEVQREATQAFDQRYRPLSDYPPERCAQLYAGYARDLGGTKEALEHLGHLTKLTPQEISMATARKEAVAAKHQAEAKAKAPGKQLPVKKVAAPKKEAPAKKADGPKRPSAAQRFMELIMAGKQTDDQIFETVQKEFGLDDNKKGYVRWYRNYLIKQGEKPPQAKG